MITPNKASSVHNLQGTIYELVEDGNFKYHMHAPITDQAKLIKPVWTIWREDITTGDILPPEVDGAPHPDNNIATDPAAFDYFGAPLWTPSEITTAAWYDASDLDTITESAGKVSQWDDKSGNNNNLVQEIASLQGTINGDTMEYVNGQRFDQSNLVNMLDSSGQFTTIIVHDMVDSTASTAGFPLIIDLQDDEPGTGVEKRRPGFLYVQTSGNFAMHASGGIVTDNSPPTGPAIIGGTGDGVNLHLDINGETMSTAGYTPRTFTTLQNFRLGDISIQNLTMKFKEVIHIAGVFDQTIYDKLTGYLADKWWRQRGQPVPLSPGHPYYLNPPTV